MEEKQNFWHSKLLACLMFASYIGTQLLFRLALGVKLKIEFSTLVVSFYEALGVVLIVVVLYFIGNTIELTIPFSEFFRVYLLSLLPEIVCRLIGICLLFNLGITKGVALSNAFVAFGKIATLLYFYRFNRSEAKFKIKTVNILTVVLFLITVLPLIRLIF